MRASLSVTEMKCVSKMVSPEQVVRTAPAKKQPSVAKVTLVAHKANVLHKVLASKAINVPVMKIVVKGSCVGQSKVSVSENARKTERQEQSKQAKNEPDHSNVDLV